MTSLLRAVSVGVPITENVWNFCITLGGVSHVGSYDLPKEKVGLVNDAAIGKTENVRSLLTSSFSSSDIGDR